MQSEELCIVMYIRVLSAKSYSAITEVFWKVTNVNEKKYRAKN